MALPFITFAVAIGALLGNSIHAAMVAVGVLAAPTYFRVVRSAVLRTARSQYVEAARLFGVPVWRIVLTHVLPRLVPVLLVTSASVLAGSLLVVASLTFLGVGVQPPAPTWGGMLSADLSYLALRPLNPVAPALAIMVTVAALGILADRIRDLPTALVEDDAEAVETSPAAADPAVAGAESATASAEAVVAIEDLRISAESGRELVRGVSLRVPRGASVGVLGESGSGKTMTVKALLGALPDGVRVTGGSIAVDGDRVGSVFQDPATWFAPHLTVGAQLDDVLRHAQGLGKAEARARRRELLTHVGLHEPDRVAAQYVHQLSGGMVQRILLAIAVSGEPDLLVADEATTALDVTVQAEVLSLIRRLRDEHALSVLMISHDLAVLAHSCEYLYVFRDGVVVESGPTDQVLRAPVHAYTRALVADHTVFGIEAVRREAEAEEAAVQTGVTQS
jgi:peptide/nickel transport system permease protein